VRSGTFARSRVMRRSMEGDLARLARSMESSLAFGSLGLWTFVRLMLGAW
jgi:hypothetical protein